MAGRQPRANNADVTDVPLDRDGAARQALAEIIRDYGPTGIDDPKLLNRLLPDLLAGANREAALLLAAASAGVGRLLAERTGHGMPIESAVRDVSTMIAARNAFDRLACDWVVNTYAQAMGLLAPSVSRSGTFSDPTRVDSVSRHPQTLPADRAPEITSYDRQSTSAPPGGSGVPVRRKRRTGLIIGVVGAVLVVGAGGVAFVVLTGTPKTGAACLVGDWNVTVLRSGTLLGGDETVSFHSDGSGVQLQNNAVIRDDSGIDTYNGALFFRYQADDSLIHISQLNGTVRVTNSNGTTEDVPVTNDTNDRKFTCHGDSLTLTDSTGSQTEFQRQ